MTAARTFAQRLARVPDYALPMRLMLARERAEDASTREQRERAAAEAEAIVAEMRRRRME